MDLSGYHLTFDDEFNGFSWNKQANTSVLTSVPSGTWATKYWWEDGIRSFTTNGELQFYSDSTVGPNPFSLQNGALVISAKPSAEPSATGGLPYTSGMITTEGTFSQTYGYFEMRAELPSGNGLWPAFWLLPQDHSWPPEIDVMEVIGSQPNTVNATLHSRVNGQLSSDHGDVTLPTLNMGYHTYGALWTQSNITFFVDGQQIFQSTTPADMHKPMYLLANLAVGGYWPGAPDAGTQFPAEMKIDYIRAYSNDPTAPAVQQQAVSTPDAGLPTAAGAAHSAAPKLGAVATNVLLTGQMTGTTGNDVFQTGYGDRAERAGGDGDDTYIITDDRLPIIEQPNGGIDRLEVWMNYTMPAEVENAVVKNDSGISLIGNALSNIIEGGNGDDMIQGRAGDDLLSGGAGADSFVMRAGEGYDTIKDFQAGDAADHDIVVLVGYGFQTVAQALAALASSGSNTVLHFDNGETLTFLGRVPAAFTAANFRLEQVSAGSAVGQPVGCNVPIPAVFGSPGIWGEAGQVWSGQLDFDGTSYQTFGANPAWGSLSTGQLTPKVWDTNWDIPTAADNFVTANLNLRATGARALDVMIVSAQNDIVQLSNGNWVAHNNDKIAGDNFSIKAGGGDDVVHLTAASQNSLADYDKTSNGSLYNASYDGNSSNVHVAFGVGQHNVVIEDVVRVVLNAGSGFATATSGKASDLLRAGSGGDFINSAGRDTFIFDKGDGHVTSQDFTSSADHLKFTDLTKADVHTAATTEAGVAALLVTYDADGNSAFPTHASKIAAVDMLLA